MGAKKPSDRPSIMPIPPNVPVSRPIGGIGVGGGPGIPPRFPRRRRPPLSKPSKEELINDPRVRRELEITRRRLKDQPVGRR